MPKLNDNMTKSLISVRWKFPVADAWKLMQERNIRHLPVMDAEGAVVGILSDRDVKRAMDPKHPTFAAGAIVGDFMSWPAISVESTTPLEKVVKIMIEGKISALLVTRKNAVVGITTTEDMLMLLHGMLLNAEHPEKLTLADLKYEPIWREAMREAGAVGI